MNTRQKIMGLAALPLAGLLAVGGTAMAQASGSPAGTQVVQQAVTHRAGDPCPQPAVKVTVRPAACQLRTRDRDCGARDGRHARAGRTAVGTMEHARDGSCARDADR